MWAAKRRFSVESEYTHPMVASAAVCTPTSIQPESEMISDNIKMRLPIRYLVRWHA